MCSGDTAPQLRPDRILASLLAARSEGARRIHAWPGDIWSKKVKRVSIEGRGYGLRASSDLIQGELIGATRSLAVVYIDELPLSAKELCGLSPLQQRQFTFAELAKQLCRKVLLSTNVDEALTKKGLVRHLFSMYDGSDCGYGIEPKDHSSERAAARLGLDDDGLACIGGLRRGAKKESVADLIVVDPQRVFDIVLKNGDYAECAPACSSVDRPGRVVQGSQLFVKAAWSNHSFDPNVVHTTICDVSLVLAARDIKAGEELCRAYVPWSWDQNELSEAMATYGIDVDACIAQGASRLLPKQLLCDERWELICRLLARVGHELCTKEADLKKCDSVLANMWKQSFDLLEVSPYVNARFLLMVTDVKTRQMDLAAAIAEASKLNRLLSQAGGPVPKGELGDYCVVLLFLLARLHLAAQGCGSISGSGLRMLPPGGRVAIIELLASVRHLSASYLMPGEEILIYWIRWKFAESGLAEILLEVFRADGALVVQDSSLQPHHDGTPDDQRVLSDVLVPREVLGDSGLQQMAIVQNVSDLSAMD